MQLFVEILLFRPLRSLHCSVHILTNLWRRGNARRKLVLMMDWPSTYWLGCRCRETLCNTFWVWSACAIKLCNVLSYWRSMHEWSRSRERIIIFILGSFRSQRLSSRMRLWVDVDFDKKPEQVQIPWVLQSIKRAYTGLCRQMTSSSNGQFPQTYIYFSNTSPIQF